MSSSKTKTYKLDIFDVLGKLSKGNAKFYKDLTEDEQKALQPLVVMRWMTGSNDPRRIVFLNELVNPFVFPLTHHKELLVDLIAIASPGGSSRFKWTKAKSSTTTKMPATSAVIKDIWGYNTHHANDAIPLLSDDEILDFADQLGRQPDEIKAIKKELKAR